MKFTYTMLNLRKSCSFQITFIQLRSIWTESYSERNYTLIEFHRLSSLHNFCVSKLTNFFESFFNLQTLFLPCPIGLWKQYFFKFKKFNFNKFWRYFERATFVHGKLDSRMQTIWHEPQQCSRYKQLLYFTPNNIYCHDRGINTNKISPLVQWSNENYKI